MTRILLVGCLGRMGRVITACVAEREDAEIVAGVDLITGDAAFPVYQSIQEVQKEADVIIDFSHPSSLDSILEYASQQGLPCVLATTGYNDVQTARIKEAGAKIPIFFSFNMSLGVNLLCQLSRIAAGILGNSFDIEIVEAHHNQKVDAPSGTAIMLADEINDALDNSKELVYNRHDRRAKREKKEIGMHAIRGGTIVGEHQVIFAGRDEIVTLSHSARSKEVFAAGAVSAAIYMAGKPVGLYNMKNLVADSVDNEG